MTQYEVVVTPSAIEDIANLVRYLSDDLQDDSAARRYYGLCNDVLASLADMPERYPISRTDALSERGLRTIPIGSYVGVYGIIESQHKVEVYRALYSRMDLSAAFSESERWIL